jgi:hypothetical protein
VSNVYRLPMLLAPTLTARYRAELEKAAGLMGIDLPASEIGMLADRFARELRFSPASSDNETA